MLLALTVTLFFQDFAPSEKSIIDVQDFNSVTELVDFIKKLDADDREYDSYRDFKQTKVRNQKLKGILDNRAWEPDFDVLGRNDGTLGNFVDHFDCYLCDLIHDQIEADDRLEQVSGLEVDVQKARRREVVDFKVSKDHYGCPLPSEFVSEMKLGLKRPFSQFWYTTWMVSYCDMKAMLELSNGGKNYYSHYAFKAASSRCLYDGHYKRTHLD